jgi:hypothetical protein
MKKTLLFALVLTAFCIMPSCEKDPISNDEPNEQSSDNIVFGNYEGMIVTTYDNLEWNYSEDSEHVFYSLYINLDTIGEYNGFCLYSHLSRNPIAHLLTDPLNYYEIYIISDNVKFNCNSVNKEAYYHADSTIIQTDSIQLIYIDDILSCNKISESDQLLPDYSREDVILVQHNTNETLGLEDYYKTLEYSYLFQSNSVFPTQIVLDTTDVIVYDTFTYATEECFNFPLNEEFYLGFKYGERLGWIKLIIELNANGHYCPKPLEVAVQK